jgi:transcriptional regulator with XRE-family HTH domain
MESKRERALATTVGVAIAQERSRAGLTQDQVAEALGIGPEAVSRIERGVVLPSLARLVDLAELFACPVERFVKRGSDLTADHASLIQELIGPLKKGDRQFVVDLVERTCAHLGAKR